MNLVYYIKINDRVLIIDTVFNIINIKQDTIIISSPKVPLLIEVNKNTLEHIYNKTEHWRIKPEATENTDFTYMIREPQISI